MNVPATSSAGFPREYTLPVVVAPEDIDDLEHASNIAYVRWIQAIAIAHSSAVGLDFDAYKKLGGAFFVRRHEIDYLRPVVRGERLALRTWIDSAMAAKCTRATEISNEGGTVVCRSMTTWGFVELATGRPTRIPPEIRSAFGFPSVSTPPPPVKEPR
jgi:acyl-CoA thioester hydrolase